MSFTEDRDVFFTSKLNKFIASSQSCILFIFTSEITKTPPKEQQILTQAHLQRLESHRDHPITCLLITGFKSLLGRKNIIESPTREMTYDVLDADGVPALHDGKKGDEGGNEPAAAEHRCYSHRGHLVSVDQRLAADGVIPAVTHTVQVSLSPWRQSPPS